MARQRGIIKIKGTIGDMTFYKSKDGYMVREKGGIEPKRIATDPAFQRTRENNAEFGRAGRAGKLIRQVFRTLLVKTRDPKMVGRLTRRILEAIKVDPINERGLRNLMDGNPELLTGFDFNLNGKLSTTLLAAYAATIDRASGELSIDITEFIPQEMIAAPQGATHFQIFSGGAEIDFSADTFTYAASESGILPWDNNATTAISQVNALTANSELPLFLALGIAFYQEINGAMYPLKNGSFNPLSFVIIEKPA